MTNNTTSLNITTVARPASSCNFRLFTNTEKLIQASSFFLIIFLSIICNTIVITIIKKTKRMHIPTNFFIVNLCVVNLVITLLNTIPDIQGRIAPSLGFAVSGKCIFCCLLLYIRQFVYCTIKFIAWNTGKLTFIVSQCDGISSILLIFSTF